MLTWKNEPKAVIRRRGSYTTTLQYYYWQYTAHPDSSFSFGYDDIVFAPDARSAYLQSEVSLFENPDYEYDVGVHVVVPVDKLVAEEYGDTEQPAAVDVFCNSRIIEACQDALTSDMLRKLGEKQEKQRGVYPDRHPDILDWPYKEQ